MDINIVNVVFDTVLDGEIASLGIVEGARAESLMGVTKEYTINIEGDDGENVCDVCGGPVVWIHGL